MTGFRKIPSESSWEITDGRMTIAVGVPLAQPRQCTADGGVFGSVAEALRSLAEVQAKFTAAHASVLGRFDAADAHDSDDDGFDDRYVQAGTTFGGAGVIRGNLTPECAAAVQAVLEALGKKAEQEDTRTEGQRFHDALQQGCVPLPRAGDLTLTARPCSSALANFPTSSSIRSRSRSAQPGPPQPGQPPPCARVPPGWCKINGAGGGA
jgi:hypothetical protein